MVIAVQYLPTLMLMRYVLRVHHAVGDVIRVPDATDLWYARRSELNNFIDTQCTVLEKMDICRFCYLKRFDSLEEKYI